MPRSFVLLLLASAAMAQAPDKTKPSDWPTLLGPNGDGSSPDRGILTKWPKDGLKKLWEARLGEGYAPPVVAAGKLYHFDRFEDQATLTCRDAATGKTAWKYSYTTEYEDRYGYEPGPRACPVVDGDKVFVLGPEGTLAAVRTEDGKELWKLDTRKEYHVHQNFFGVGSTPLVVGDLLIVAIGGSPKGPRPRDLREAVGNSTGLVAFEKATGKEKYRATDELASYSSPMLAKLHGQSVVLYLGRRGLVALDPAKGKELFSHAWRAKGEESVNAANPVVLGDSILLSECYGMGSAKLDVDKDWKVAVAWSDAEKDRREKSLLSHWCTPIADEGSIYGSSGRHESEADLRCIDANSGEVKWVKPKTRRCTLTKIDGHLLCLAEDGTLTLVKLNAEKYEAAAVWSERDNPDLAYPCWAPPVVADGRVYLRGKGKLICCELLAKRP